MTAEEKAAQVLQDAISETVEEDEDARKAEIIRKEALLDRIKDCACIRWADGLSDSLFDAVLSFYKPLGETVQRDKKGRIILRQKTDWDAELNKYRKENEQ